MASLEPSCELKRVCCSSQDTTVTSAADAVPPMAPNHSPRHFDTRNRTEIESIGLIVVFVPTGVLQENHTSEEYGGRAQSWS